VDIAFDTKELEGPAGIDFTITLTNNGAAEHDFIIRDTEFGTALVAGGASETITVNLPAGEYTFFCSVPGHEAAGMVGTLTITEGGGAAAPEGDDEPAKEPEGDATEESTEGEAPVAPGESVDLNIEAVDIAFDTKALEGPANTDFTITLTNNGAAQHDFVIEGTDFKTEILNAGESQTITVNLPAGEYTFFCSIPGHRPAGMEGTLTITEGGGAVVAPAEEEASEEADTTEETTGDEAPVASGESVDLNIEAVDIAFDTKELAGPANTDFTITLTNNGAAQHDFVIEGTDFKTEILNAGQSETITVNLPAGEYTFFCSIPGHRPAGMEGTLTITEGGGAVVAPAEEEAAEEDATAEADASEEATGDDAAATAGEPVELQIEAVDIAFDTKELAGPANTDFTITLTNNGAAQHDFVIEGTDFKTEILNAGQNQTITVNLPAGEYIFYCSIPGHRPAGMEGTLTITEAGGAAAAPADEEATEEAATEATAEATPADAATPEASGEPVELQIEAVDIAFDTKELAAPAGVDFTITLTNNGAAQHDFIIEGTDFKTEILNAGQSETITVNLPAGEYTFYCSIPGHRPAGMEGKLIVTEQADSGDDDASAGGEAVDVQIEAVDIAFDTKELEGPANTDFTITLTNNGAAQHDFVIEGTDFKTTILNAGQSETITVNLPPGEYTYYCSIPGHRPSGMEGKLIIS
ncbi:MAG: cupredoxin domain-containing protein, partial [Thermomicrobiales bacterium]|nr:cupredoxin domain-containing protein [Thermomicrobiales bacterium]